MDVGVKGVSALVVDDDADNIALMERILRSFCQVYSALSGEQAIATLEAHREIQIIITDQRMPGATGVDVLRAARALVPHAARVIVTGYTEFQDVLRAINEGHVNHVLVKPLEPAVLISVVDECLEVARLRQERDGLLEELRAENHILADTARRFQNLATDRAITVDQLEEIDELRDTLTNLSNYSQFRERFSAEVARARRHHRPLSVVVIHVDGPSDRRGVAASDRTLTAVADTLKNTMLRTSDVLARLGGPRFSIILPETNRQGAQSVMDRIRERVGALVLVDEAGASLAALSAIIGCATLGEDGTDPASLLQAATQGLPGAA